jgi:RNA recognition motif-containing protein
MNRRIHKLVLINIVLRRTAMKIYVGNLAATTTDVQLGEAFAPHGTVDSSRLAKDKESGELRGFGFIEMGVEAEASAAIAALNGTDLGGNAIRVSEAKKKEAVAGS